MKKRRRHKRADHTMADSVTVRNTMARHPLLKKAAVHGQSKKAKRQQDRVRLKKECDWQNIVLPIAQVTHLATVEDVLSITFPTRAHTSRHAGAAGMIARH